MRGAEVLRQAASSCNASQLLPSLVKLFHRLLLLLLSVLLQYYAQVQHSR